MLNRWQTIGRIAFAVACLLVLGLSDRASAREEATLMLPAPAAEEIPVAGPVFRPVMLGGGCAMNVAPTCPTNIDYRTHRSARRAYRRSGEMPLVVLAKNPADCCDYEVPLCVPCCCEGAPCVTGECGLLGRGRVEYCWECGFTATVVFKARGDIKVHYRG
jgi:hypothetical protein